MKNAYILLTALFVVCAAAPSAAQDNTLQNKVKRAIAAQRQPDAMAKKAKQDSRAHHPCAYCGEEITDPYQHCPAKHGVGLCSEQKKDIEENNTQNVEDNFCPKCGHEYTVDEKYHGVKHICSEQEKQVCAYCGEEITHSCQHCSAKDGTGVCSEHKKDTENNTHSVQDNFCPKCGHEYTVDEKYHGIKHVCSEPEKKVCTSCGEEIVEPYQHCAAKDYTGVCAATAEKTTKEQKPQSTKPFNADAFH